MVECTFSSRAWEQKVGSLCELEANQINVVSSKTAKRETLSEKGGGERALLCHNAIILMQPTLLYNIYFRILGTGSHTVVLAGLEHYAALLPQPRVVGLQMCDCHHLWLILHIETKLFSKDSIFWNISQ